MKVSLHIRWALMVLVLSCDSVRQNSEEPASAMTPLADAPLTVARQHRERFEMLEAAAAYIRVPARDNGELLRERAEHLLQASEFYRSVAELTFELRRELLGRWMEQWRAGELESDLTPALTALDAAHQGRWSEVLDAAEAAPFTAVPEWIAARVLLAGAQAARALADGGRADQFLADVEGLSVGSDVDVQLVRRLLLAVAPVDVPVSDFDELDGQRRNAALVDVARAQLAVGDAKAAFATLRQHDLRAPFATEGIGDGIDERRFLGGEVVELLGQVCLALAYEDLMRASELAKGPAGVLLGVACLRRGDAPGAATAFDAALADSDTGPIDRAMAEGGRRAARAMAGLVKAGLIEQTAGLAGASRQAFLARELSLQERDDLAATLVEGALDTIMGNRARGQVETTHRYFAALWSIETLYRSGVPDPDRVYDAINVAHDPTLGYNPKRLPGGHLLELMRTYRSIHDRKAEDILGGLVQHYDEVLAAHSLLQYLNSTKGAGLLVPGDGSN